MTGPISAGQKVASGGCEETTDGETDDHRVLFHYNNIITTSSSQLLRAQLFLYISSQIPDELNMCAVRATV